MNRNIIRFSLAAVVLDLAKGIPFGQVLVRSSFFSFTPHR